MGDGLHAQPGVLERVAQVLLQPPDVPHQPRRRFRLDVGLQSSSVRGERVS